MARNEKEFVHPELRKGEVFLFNATVTDYASSTYTTKRLGNTTYDMAGRSMDPGLPAERRHPLFVPKKEFDARFEALSRYYKEHHGIVTGSDPESSALHQ